MFNEIKGTFRKEGNRNNHRGCVVRATGGEIVAVPINLCNTTQEVPNTVNKTRNMEIKTSSSPTHCSKYFLPLKIRGSSGDIMKEEGSSRRIGLKRKRSRIGKMKDILTHRRGENSNDVGGCGGDTYYLPEKLGNKPLRCVFVGINPSEVAWQQGE